MRKTDKKTGALSEITLYGKGAMSTVISEVKTGVPYIINVEGKGSVNVEVKDVTTTTIDLPGKVDIEKAPGNELKIKLTPANGMPKIVDVKVAEGKSLGEKSKAISHKLVLSPTTPFGVNSVEGSGVISQESIVYTAKVTENFLGQSLGKADPELFSKLLNMLFPNKTEDEVTKALSKLGKNTKSADVLKVIARALDSMDPMVATMVALVYNPARANNQLRFIEKTLKKDQARFFCIFHSKADKLPRIKDKRVIYKEFDDSSTPEVIANLIGSTIKGKYNYVRAVSKEYGATVVPESESELSSLTRTLASKEVLDCLMGMGCVESVDNSELIGKSSDVVEGLGALELIITTIAAYNSVCQKKSTRLQTETTNLLTLLWQEIDDAKVVTINSDGRVVVNFSVAIDLINDIQHAFQGLTKVGVAA